MVGGLISATITGAAAVGTAGGTMGALLDMNIATAENVQDVVSLVAAHQPIELEQRMDLWRRDQMREPVPQA